MPQPCKNHPELIANKRCYRCKKSICSSCIHRAFHHLFCGIQCISLFYLNNLICRLKFRELLILSGSTESLSPHNKLRFSPERYVLYFLIFLNIFIFAYLINRISYLSDDISDLKHRIESASRTDGTDSEPRDPYNFAPQRPDLDSLLSSTVFTGEVSLSGNARDDNLIILYVNDRLEDARRPSKGNFSFKSVTLNPGRNRLVLRAVSPDKSVLEFADLDLQYSIPFAESLTSNIERGTVSEPSVALTFDGGSLANNAQKILDILKQKQVTSTMFLTGVFIQNYPDTVRRIVSDGHETGNHTFSHGHLTSFADNSRHETLREVNFSDFSYELFKTDSLFLNTTGVPMKKYWRAPYGEVNKELREWAASRGYRHISWTRSRLSGRTMDSLDWVSDESSTLYKSAAEIRKALLNFAIEESNGANGAIILMHLGSTRKTDDLYESLPDIIDGFREMGYSFATVTDLLSTDNQILSEQ